MLWTTLSIIYRVKVLNIPYPPKAISFSKYKSSLTFIVSWLQYYWPLPAGYYTYNVDQDTPLQGDNYCFVLMCTLWLREQRHPVSRSCARHRLLMDVECQGSRGEPRNLSACCSLFITYLSQGRRSGICSGTTMSGRPKADQ